LRHWGFEITGAVLNLRVVAILLVELLMGVGCHYKFGYLLIDSSDQAFLVLVLEASSEDEIVLLGLRRGR